MKIAFCNMLKGAFALLLLAPLPLVASGQHAGGHGSEPGADFGVPGQPEAARRSIVVEAGDDMRFRPAHIRVRRGETVRFVVRNRGTQTHEFVLGRSRELTEHAALMRRYPDMEHSDPNMVRVAPGQEATLTWTFTRAGQVEFACLIPGHFEAGMRGRIRVR
ncbi:cupredoxin domain-containing protein [Thiobacter aerophilum]|uniref:Cupredoxin family protein n=1 Tax=Thiobacter aerophilum TaxID=3121275 RepID=A0ABV0EFL3_9BURK